MNKVISAKVSKEYYDKVVSLGPISDIVRKAVDNYFVDTTETKVYPQTPLNPSNGFCCPFDGSECKRNGFCRYCEKHPVFGRT